MRRPLDPLHRARRSRRCRSGAGRCGRAPRAAGSPRRRRPCRGRAARARAGGARGCATRGGPRSARRARPGCPRSTIVSARVLPGSVSSVADEHRPLAVDHDQAADLADVGPRPDQLGVLHHRGLAAAGLDHDLDAGAVAGLERARLEHRELALGVAEQRAVAAEQGAVEVGVDAAEGQGRNRIGVYGSDQWLRGGSSATGCSTSSRRSAPASSTSPTTRCSRGRAAGRPSARSRTASALAEAGFDMLDVGAVAARSGPPVPAEEEAARLVPAIEGLAARTELPISADTFSAEVARRALDGRRRRDQRHRRRRGGDARAGRGDRAAAWWSCTSRARRARTARRRATTTRSTT